MTGIRVFSGFSSVFLEVGQAFIPLLVCFLVFQGVTSKLSRVRFFNILKGLLLTFIGLSLFLQGVKVGFLPAGQAMGAALNGLSAQWLLLPIGFIIGLVTTLAEPSVHTLNYEVESASGGYIPRKIMLYTLALGVGVSVMASMARILLGIPLWYFLISGYLLAFILSRWCSRSFVAIAFDSGSVATGPMTVTFIMAITLGLATEMKGRDPLLEGFGMIALVAISSILSVLFLGVLYAKKEEEIRRKMDH